MTVRPSAPTDPPPSPPRLAQRLLAAGLPDSEREELLGDLAETFAQRARSGGRPGATAWYWRQVLAAPVRVAIEARRAVPGDGPAPRRRGLFDAVESWCADLRLGLRRSRQRPGVLLSGTVVLSLAVGGSTALIAAVDRYARWDPGLREAGSLQALTSRFRDENRRRYSVADWRRIVAAAPETPLVAVAHRFVVARSDAGATTEWSATVSEGFFSTIGAPMARGRGPAAGADEVVVSFRFWRTRLGGRDDALGEALWINGRLFSVVGVVDPDFNGLSGRPALWLPIESLGDAEGDALAVVVLACLCQQHDLSPAADSIAAALTAAAAADYAAGTDTDTRGDAGADARGDARIVTARFIPAADIWVPRAESSMVSRANLTIALLALLVIAAACANVANLLLADGLTRDTEMAVRAAIGAGRGRLLRQLLLECGTLAVAVCAGSYAVAVTILAAVPRWLPTPIPGFEQRLELPVTALAGGLVLALAVTLVAGLFPALRLTRRWAGSVAGSRGRRIGGALDWLGGTQVAASAALTLIALFLTAGMDGIHDLPLGYTEAERYSFTLDAGALPPDAAARADAYRRFFAELESSPSVTAAGIASMVPGFLGAWTPVYATDPDAPTSAAILGIGQGYLEAAGTRILEGRSPRREHGGLRLALVSRTLATSLWSAGDALGRTIAIGTDGETLRVVGVIEDGTYAGPEILPVIMRPLPDPAGSGAFVVVHARGGIGNVAETLRAAMRATHMDLSMHSLAPVSEWFDRHWVLQRSVGAVLRTLATLGLIISGIGVYAGFSTMVARRRHELGVRLSIGASPPALVRLVLGHAARVAACGYLAGIALAAAGTRLVEAYMFDAGVADPVPHAIGIILILLVACGASLLPAMRAARVDPVISMRGH